MTLGPALMKALLKLDELGETDSWLKFAMVGRYNAMRHLRRRKLIEDLNERSRRAYCEIQHPDGQDPWEAYPIRYRLTELGRAAVAAHKRAEDIP